MSPKTASLMKDILQFMRDNQNRHVWETGGIAKPFMDNPNTYTPSSDQGYRRVLVALWELEKQQYVKTTSTTMNCRVWWLGETVQTIDYSDYIYT